MKCKNIIKQYRNYYIYDTTKENKKINPNSQMATNS